MIEILLTAGILLAFGAQPLLPWRAASLPAERRKTCILLALPLLAAGTLAGVLLLEQHPDAALAQGLSPGNGSPYDPAMLVLLGALTLALVLAWVAGPRLEPNGWRILALFGLFVLLAATFGAEVLRIGEGAYGALTTVFALIACRLLIALGAGEVLAPGRPLLAPAAALGLAGYFALLPRAVTHSLLASQAWLPFASAALLFAGARWLPERLRRPALLAATLLASVALTLAAAYSRATAPLPMEGDFSAKAIEPRNTPSSFSAAAPVGRG
jgi:hypothetical protein